MKKNVLILGIMLIIVLFALTACGESTELEAAIDTYQNSLDAVNSGADTLAATELAVFNAQFEDYEGEQTGASVKSLISRVISNNDNFEDVEEKNVTIEYDGEDYEGDEISSLSTKFTTTKTYEVEFEYSSYGYISKIIISK